MAPKGGNAKKESGRAKKAENEAKKQEAAAERKEAEAWTDKDVKGGKASKEEKEEKRRAELARKAENARLLAEEEASAPAKVKAAPKAVKKAQKPAGPGAIAAGGGLAAVAASETQSDKGMSMEEPESFSATGIDNALDLLEVVTAKMDKASVGQQAADIEQHPEVGPSILYPALLDEIHVHSGDSRHAQTAFMAQIRFLMHFGVQAAFEAYQERELPVVRQEHPGLRLQQYKELLFKQFKKSPENPFNQVVVDYDASKEDKLEALKLKKAQVEDRLREKRSS
ncbi:DUF1014-domain-containing protein [Mycena sanguinolenta]|uniref:DUF1014-domain-containing protein n=1 Tax=Mycena sanguinolenta TaxID=230812 RepID=A0A8H6YDJ0_9AGAR|nr:DUF1014-domain-containing protein [Mycena sanguinolenta]